MYILRVPDQNSMSQACYIVKIYHSGPEPSIYRTKQRQNVLFLRL